MINVQNINYSYTGKPFIKNMSFKVRKGEIFGFLGPSGAGKSTLQKILTGMLPGYQGSVIVNGSECRKLKKDFYENIGVDFEFSTMYEKLTARENLNFFSSLYEWKQSQIAEPQRRIDELLERMGLLQDANKKVAEYSKGMKARLNFIKALFHEPDILFLDEPTSGLDPTNNRLMKDMILEEREKGKTILLTTHNMQDATELCDRVAFIVNGQMMALDTPHNLIMSKGAASITYSWREKTEAGEEEKSMTCALNQISTDEKLSDLIAHKIWILLSVCGFKSDLYCRAHFHSTAVAREDCDASHFLGPGGNGAVLHGCNRAT